MSPTADILRKSRPSEKMSIVVLFGKSSQGKSSTLQHLSVLLLSGGNSPDSTIQKAFENKFWNGRTYNDFMLILKYRREADGKEARIYLSTKGDTWEIVENNFEFFYRQSKRQGKTIHVFNGTEFIEWKDLDDEEKKQWLQDSPTICITPANFRRGSIQALRYYLDATYDDWKCEHWIRRERINTLKDPVDGYVNHVIYKTHEKIANNMMGLIHSCMDYDY